MKKYLLKFVLAVFFCVPLVNVQAIEYGMLGGKPANFDPNIPNSSSWFIYNLNPGEKKEDAAVIMNLYEKPLDVLVYAADGVRSSGGGFALRQFSEPKEAVGSWVRFYPQEIPSVFKGVFEKKGKSISSICVLDRNALQEENGKVKFFEDEFIALEEWCRGTDKVELKMKEKEQLLVPFIFSVPLGVDVGEHTGGILIQKAQAENSSDQEGSSVKLTTRVGVRIYQTVPGEIVKKLTMESFQAVKNFKEFDFSRWFKKDVKPEDYLIQARIANDGNVSVDFQSVINIKDEFFGKRDQEIAERNFQVLKKDVFISNYSWENPRFGKFTFNTKIKYLDSDKKEQEIVSSPITIWVMPWREMATAAFFVLLLCGAYCLWRYIQKKKYGGIGWVEYEVRKNDDINKLAKRFEIDWKTLAKTNRLSPPYLLDVGQVILTPPLSQSDKKGKNKESETMAAKFEAIVIDEVQEKKDEKGSKKGGRKKKIKEKEKKDEFEEKKQENIVSKAAQEIKNEGKWLGRALILFVIVALMALGIFWALKSKNNSVVVEKKISISSLPEEKPAEIAVENDFSKPDVAVQNETKQKTIEELNIKILNGSGQAGIAGKMKEILELEGYKKLTAGNAEKENYSGQTVYFQDGLEKDAEKLKEIVKKKYPKAIIKSASSEEEKSAEIVLIIGK